MNPLLREFAVFIDQGGFVMWPLILLTFTLWFALGNRFLLLSRYRRGRVRAVVRSVYLDPNHAPDDLIGMVAARMYTVRMKYRGDVRGMLQYIAAPFEERVGSYRGLVRTIVVIAPLAGLLGTVSGMIEMFDSLSDQVFFSQNGGIANGISEALITTQLGLAIAIPGLIAGRLLDRKERAVRSDLAQLIEGFSKETELSE